MPGSSDIGGLNLPGLFALLFVVGVFLAPVFFGRDDDPGGDSGGGGGGGGGPKSPPQPPTRPKTGIDPHRTHGRRRLARAPWPARRGQHVAAPSPRRNPHPPKRRPRQPSRGV